jgi:hypothetical protein
MPPWVGAAFGCEPNRLFTVRMIWLLSIMPDTTRPMYCVVPAKMFVVVSSGFTTKLFVSTTLPRGCWAWAVPAASRTAATAATTAYPCRMAFPPVSMLWVRAPAHDRTEYPRW